MTDNGESYEFVYDVWGRLRKITTRGGSPRLVAEYEYYGNNYRASAHYDTDVDNDVDSNDKTYYFAYNERWQMLGVYRDTDSDPKEQFVYHLAGNSGYGGSSYIDQVILRDRDDTNGWTGAADGTLEERIYYCQNWRFDVVALVTDTGELAERARYSPYGVPFGMPLGDVNGDGSVSGTDTGIILGDYSSSNWRSDLNLDGVIDSADHTIANNNFGAAGGREVLSDIGNRKGYAAYEYAFIGESLYHVRNRVYDAELARWTRRDPLGYVDGWNVYLYAIANPVTNMDASGTGPVDDCIRLWCCSWALEETKNSEWLGDLDNCPCSITITGNGPINPGKEDWEDPEPANQEYHPGAAYCMRSKQNAGETSGQQCCYDANGNLITGGGGAGTPDRVAPDSLPDYYLHWREDVVPWNVCEAAGCLNVYLLGRPPNTGDPNAPCAWNSVGPLSSCRCDNLW